MAARKVELYTGLKIINDAGHAVFPGRPRQRPCRRALGARRSRLVTPYLLDCGVHVALDLLLAPSWQC